ncbi:MAG: hypothetical protein JEZ06_23925 [Anaerolineaceae bacterium]|nr:hypothetical protein [Anaerolineaceae bacterium]
MLNLNLASQETKEGNLNNFEDEIDKKYLTDTGRLSSHWTAFIRTANKRQMPEQIHCLVVQYKSTKLAQLHLANSGYGYMDGFKRVNKNMSLGDINNTVHNNMYKTDGIPMEVHGIEFSYHNYVVNCFGLDPKHAVRHEFVENVAREMLKKLEAVPLVKPEDAVFNQPALD